MKEKILFVCILIAMFLLSSYFDLFELLSEFSKNHEGYQLDEIFTLLIIFSFLSFIFLKKERNSLLKEISLRQKAKIELDKALALRDKLLEDLKHSNEQLQRINSELKSEIVEHNETTNKLEVEIIKHKNTAVELNKMVEKHKNSNESLEKSNNELLVAVNERIEVENKAEKYLREIQRLKELLAKKNHYQERKHE